MTRSQKNGNGGSGVSDIEWPTLWIDEEEDFPQIGTPELEWQGKPLTIPTIDEWTLAMGRDSIHTVTVRIPVRVRTRAKVVA